jgi:cell division septum initiation protein DivIVA
MASEDPAAPVVALLDRLQRTVEQARAVPVSASCVVNREELLALVEDLRAALPQALDRARSVLADRQGVVEQGRTEAERLLAEADAQRRALVAGTEVVKAAEQEAARIREQARAEADAVRAEVEEYADKKLANFEVVLSKTLAAVQRGRARLHGESELDALAAEPVDEPLPGA